MPINDVYRVEVWQNVGSEPTMNVLHILETVAETGAGNVAQLANTMTGALYDAMSAELSEDWRVVMISARRVSPTGGIPDTTVFGGAEAIVGQVADEIVPSGSAVLISHYTDTPSRDGRGRTFLPGLPESSQNEGQFVEARFIALNSIVQTEFLGEKTPLGATTGRFRFMVFGGGASPSIDYVIRQSLVRPNLASQRRRRAFPGFAP